MKIVIDYDNLMEKKDSRTFVYREEGVKGAKVRKKGKQRGRKHFHSLRIL